MVFDGGIKKERPKCYSHARVSWKVLVCKKAVWNIRESQSSNLFAMIHSNIFNFSNRPRYHRLLITDGNTKHFENESAFRLAVTTIRREISIRESL